MNLISIIGAGGQTRSSINLLKRGFPGTLMKIYDDSFSETRSESILGIDIQGVIEDISDSASVFLSVGDNSKRENLFRKFKHQLITDTLMNANVIIESNVNMGISNQIYSNVYINSEVVIGDNNIINTGAIIEHESVVGNHNHISVGATLCGRVRVGNLCTIGAGAVVINGVSIADGVVIGAGACVVNDIDEPGTYVGVPVRRVD